MPIRFFASIGAVLVLSFGAEWIGVRWKFLGLFARTIIVFNGLATLAVGLILLLVVLIGQWYAMWNLIRVNRMTLAAVEMQKPRLPRSLEIIATNVFTVAFLVLSIQFVGLVYAMSFTLSSTTAETSDTRDIFLADLDGDGDLDFLSGNISADHDFYKNDGTGTYTRETGIGGFTTFTAFDAGDLDGDGDVDYAMVGVNGANCFLTVYKNLGSFSFAAGYVYQNPCGTLVIRRALIVDVDNDGDMDLVSGANTVASQAVHLNDGHGNFTIADSSLTAVITIHAADFTSDGYQDLAILGEDNQLHIYKNSGTGAFVQLGSDIRSGLKRGFAIGDLDGDGDIDMMAQDGTWLWPLLNDGTGVFSDGTPTSSSSFEVDEMALSDLDNDGDLDMIMTIEYSGPTGGTELWTNNGSAVFSNGGLESEQSDETFAIAIGDIDADGDVDYVRGNAAADRVYKNDQAATVANTSPAVPTSLTGALQGKTPRNGATFSSYTGLGTTSWSGQSNAALSDDTRVTTGSMTTGEITHGLSAQNFRFRVPTNATILGIKVDIEKQALSGTIRDHAVRIYKTGLPGATDRSNIANWSSGTDAYVSYGGPADLWGETWTASDINGSNFGAMISAEAFSVAAGPAVDHIRITVYYTAADVRLSWGSGSDAQTPTKMLQYQVRVGTGSNTNNIVSAKTASPHWVTRMMPNGQSRTFTVKDLPCGKTFYWTVTAVDTGFRSDFASEQQFTLDADCAISFAGGGGTPPPVVPDPGGGLPWNARDHNATSSAGSGDDKGIITVSAFEDINGNGTRDKHETTGFWGLPVTASGRTADGVAVKQSLTLTDRGEAAFQLPASDDRGYWISAETGSLAVTGYRPTAGTETGSLVVRGDTKLAVAFGYRRENLIRYAPCQEIRGALPGERTENDALILLQRLENASGHRTTDGVTFGGDLMSRRDFLTLLQRIHCIPLIKDREELLNQLREVFDKNSVNDKTPIELIDLPFGAGTTDALLAYSLRAAGLPVGRLTTAGPAADLGSPISRREAVRLTVAAMEIGDAAKSGTGAIPEDLPETDPLVPEFLTLQRLKVLPESFQPVFGPDQGLDISDATLILARSAFRAGRIGMYQPVLDPGSRQPETSPGASETFLSVLPAFPLPECFLRSSDRADRVTFTDLLPGDPRYEGLRDILQLGMRNADDKMLWLFAATRRPTEFGVMSGQIALVPNEAVSVLETLRALLVLRCLPPPTPKQVILEEGRMKEGSGESRVPRDRISNLPRDTSFASRVMYRAQDREKEFDLSLFTYAPHLLLQEYRSPAEGLTIEEGSELAASALLTMLVRAEILTPQAAELFAADLAFRIEGSLLGSSLDWRTSPTAGKAAFTRQMLLEFLTTVLTEEAPAAAAETGFPIGLIWWERIK